jgi:hypothetical protein
VDRFKILPLYTSYTQTEPHIPGHWQNRDKKTRHNIPAGGYRAFLGHCEFNAAVTRQSLGPFS